MPLPPTLEIRLVAKKKLTPSVCQLTFERADGNVFDFEAGQWVSLVLPLQAGELRRAYSIASPPNRTPSFELAITHVNNGPGSTFLHDIQPGATLKAIGPQGFFTRPLEKTGPSLFIATGTGVTPLRSMMRAALSEGDKQPLWLVFGVRTEEEILYRDELEELARTHPNVRVHFSLSRPEGSWAGKTGYVQVHVPAMWRELEALGAGRVHAYVCGLQKMVGGVRDLLRKEMGVPREQVHAERYD